jgi:cytochrome c-type biogenesis protein CcsB
MEALSTLLLVVAIMSYLVAMICHAAAFATGSRGASARPAARPVRELVASGVGAAPAGSVPAGSEPARAEPARAEPSGPPPAVPPVGGAARSTDLAGGAAVASTVFAAAVHLAALVTRGIAADRMPWGNMYEFVLAVTFFGAAGWLVVLRRWPALRQLGLFVAPVQVLLLGVAGMVLRTPVVPLVPALNSYWFVIHVSTIAFSSGVLLLGSVPAAMQIMRAGYEQGRRSFPYTLARRSPSAATLERLTFGLHAFAFPIFTFAVIAGAIWAESAWGRPWGWDPKETWAFISWVVYAGYLHARATPSVRRNVAAWIALLGFATMLMNLFGVNLFFEGLHSYGGLD